MFKVSINIRHFRVHLIGVLELLIISQGLHQQMEVASCYVVVEL